MDEPPAWVTGANPAQASRDNKTLSPLQLQGPFVAAAQTGFSSIPDLWAGAAALTIPHHSCRYAVEKIVYHRIDEEGQSQSL